MSENFSEETSWSNVFRNSLAGFQVQSQKQKNREAAPIVKPCIDNEHPTNKRSTSKECCCSAAILWREESEVKSLYIKAIALFSYIKFELSDT